jgi:hypothetical protein
MSANTIVQSVSDAAQTVTLPTSLWVRITHLATGSWVLNPREALQLISVIRQWCCIINPIAGETGVDKCATRPGSYRLTTTRGCTLSVSDLELVGRLLLVLELGGVIVTAGESHG